MIKIIKELGKMCQRVTTPLKQISLKIDGIYEEAIPPLRTAIQNLHSLSIESYFDDDQEIDFTMFNNLPRLELSGLPGVRKIQSGLQNIQHLSLNLPFLIEIYDFNTSNSLKSLKLVANQLTRLPVLTNFNETFQMLIEENTWDRNTFKMQFDLKDSLLYLSSLSLSGSFLNTAFNIEPLMNVDRVSLVHWDHSTDALPQFPFAFTGRYLSLQKFLLSSWPVDLLLPNIKTLELIKCIGPTQLPEMPKLTFLSLNTISNLNEIRTFPRCVSMALDSVSSLNFVDRQPMLNRLYLIEVLFSVMDGMDKSLRSLISRNLFQIWIWVGHEILPIY
jgi:hypothetical protein